METVADKNDAVVLFANMMSAMGNEQSLRIVRLEDLWIYLTAPFVGSSLAVAAFHLVRTARLQEE